MKSLVNLLLHKAEAATGNKVILENKQEISIFHYEIIESKIMDTDRTKPSLSRESGQSFFSFPKTIVGGRPDNRSGRNQTCFPQAIETLVLCAAFDDTVKKEVLADPLRAAKTVSIELSASETDILSAVDRKSLALLIENRARNVEPQYKAKIWLLGKLKSGDRGNMARSHMSYISYRNRILQRGSIKVDLLGADTERRKKGLLSRIFIVIAIIGVICLIIAGIIYLIRLW